jgi:hypothetical protein
LQFKDGEPTGGCAAAGGHLAAVEFDVRLKGTGADVLVTAHLE